MTTADSDEAFLQALVDTLPQRIALIDERGEIQWVNGAWRRFAEDVDGDDAESQIGTNYLHVCQGAAEQEDAGTADDAAGAGAVAEGIVSVIENRAATFQHEYPCHGPDEERWFLLTVRRLGWDGPARLVVSHDDITQRKLAEQAAEARAARDGLTDIANRRRFDEFLDAEWRRAKRQKQPVSLMMIDIDEFKLFNDTFGHADGDDCLVRVAEAIDGLARRPTDLVARYGGEEFAVVLGDTSQADARTLAEDLRAAVAGLGIAHAEAAAHDHVTVSVGVATAVPRAHADPADLLQVADENLYAAKQQGRDQVVADAPAPE